MAGGAAVFFPQVTSTRERCKLADWDTEIAEARHARLAPAQQENHRKQARSVDASSQAADKPPEQPKPKKQKIDFSKLLDDKVELLPPKPAAAARPPQSHASGSSSRASSADGPATKSLPHQAHAATAKHPEFAVRNASRSPSQPPPMRSAARPSALPQPRARSLTPPPHKPLNGVVKKVVSPSNHAGRSRNSKAAAAGLRNATAPQLTSGPTKKQLATQGMQAALARMRAQKDGGTEVQGSAKPPPRSAGSAAGLPGLHSAGALGGHKGPSGGAGRRPLVAGQPAKAVAGRASPAYGGRSLVVEEEEEDDWRRELRQITGYNPNKFQDHHLDDRRMEASVHDIIREEQRSKALGRLADLEEERMEEERKRAKMMSKRK